MPRAASKRPSAKSAQKPVQKRRGASTRRAAPKPRAWLASLRRVALGLVSLCFLVAVGMGVYQASVWWQQQQPEGISRVAFSGDLRHSDKAALVAEVEPYTEAGFFAVDLAAIRSRLEANPWVYKAEVERVWPDELRVHIVEETPIAYWGDEYLINQAGALFVPRGDKDLALPVLFGPKGSAPEVMATYLLLQGLLSGSELRVDGLRMDSLGDWALELNDGVKARLGAARIERSVRRLQGLYAQQLHTQWQRVASVDFRYQRAAAVAWRGEKTAALNKNKVTEG